MQTADECLYEINRLRKEIVDFMKNLFKSTSSYRDLFKALKDAMPLNYSSWVTEEEKNNIKEFIKDEIMVYFPDVTKISTTDYDNNLTQALLNSKPGENNSKESEAEKLVDKLQSKLFTRYYSDVKPRMNHIDSCLGLIIMECLVNQEQRLFFKLRDSSKERKTLFTELKTKYNINHVSKLFLFIMFYCIETLQNVLIVYLDIF